MRAGSWHGNWHSASQRAAKCMWQRISPYQKDMHILAWQLAQMQTHSKFVSSLPFGREHDEVNVNCVHGPVCRGQAIDHSLLALLDTAQRRADQLAF
jgi:hypothetical protein